MESEKDILLREIKKILEEMKFDETKMNPMQILEFCIYNSIDKIKEE